MPSFQAIIEQTSLLIEATGVAVIALGLLVAFARFAPRMRQPGAYRALRQDIGRGILLGLELLVAGDIIDTVAVEPTLESVAILAVIVLIRTFLSMSLEVELEGRWPWRAAAARERKSAR